MQETQKMALVGLMVLIGAAAAFAVFRFVDEGSGSGDGYRVHAYFDDAQGLIPKSRVVIAGIPIGQIDRISLEGSRARVDIRVQEEIVLYEDARVAMRSQSLLGDKILTVFPGSQSAAKLGDGDELQVGREAVSTDDVLATVGEIASDVRAVTQQLERSFGNDTAGTQMASALRDLSEALASVNRTVQTNEAVISRTLANIDTTASEGGPKLLAALENIERLTRDVSQIAHARRDDVDRALGETDETVASIHRASEELEGVLADVSQVTGRAARGEGSLGRLSTDDTLIEEAEGVAEGLNNVVGGFARLQTLVELRSEYNIFANTFKTYFSLELEPSEGRFFLFQLVDDPRGSVNVTETVVQRSPALPTEPGTYQERRVTRSEELRFSLQIGKRISFATFRFGIMESTGGIGFDLHLFRNRLALSTDLFAIGVDSLPRFRSRLAIEIVKRLRIVGGIDDALNSNSDVFLGLQLSFNDRDLAGLLPFLGGSAR